MPHAEAAIIPDRDSRLWTLASAALCLLALLVQLPTTLALGLGATGLVLSAASWRRPLPAFVRIVLALAMLAAVLSVTGFRFGRDTGCALLAAMLAIKPGETRSLRDNRSLVGFALFAPFAAFLLDQGPLTMVLGALGIGSALVALHRLADVEAHSVAPGPDVVPRMALVGRLVLIGLPLVLAAFWLFPRFATPLWGVPERALSKPGLGEEMSPGGWLDLMADEDPALRAQFFGATPPPEQMYWRGPVMWNYDGRTWTQAPWLRSLPPARVQHGDRQWDYQLEVEPTDRHQLVALDLAVEAPEGAHLANDYGMTVRAPLSALTRWRMRASTPASFEATLPHLLRQQALQLPNGFDPRTRALAAQWRREAGADDAALVRRALDWIRAEFAYTLETPLPGRDAVDEFLFDRKQGYCEHFSSAFVVLMRGAGVPARVVTGYTGGVYNRLGGYWVVRQMDAHAWAEVWLSGRGWVRVDPTAAVAPERVRRGLSAAVRMPAPFGIEALRGLDLSRDSGNWYGQLRNALGAVNNGWNQWVLNYTPERQRNVVSSLQAGLSGWPFVALLTSTGILLLLYGILIRRRAIHPVEALYSVLCKRLGQHGLARAADEGPTAYAARVAAASHLAAPCRAAAADFLHRYSAWRYAPVQADPRLAATLKSLLSQVR